MKKIVSIMILMSIGTLFGMEESKCGATMFAFSVKNRIAEVYKPEYEKWAKENHFIYSATSLACYIVVLLDQETAAIKTSVETFRGALQKYISTKERLIAAAANNSAVEQLSALFSKIQEDLKKIDVKLGQLRALKADVDYERFGKICVPKSKL